MLLVDVSYFCHKAWHTTGELRNGVVFGFLKQMLAFEKKFQKHGMLFAFDSRSKRKEISTEYKADRVSEPSDRDDLYRQIAELRELLLSFGCWVEKHSGYEADDIIAAAANVDDVLLSGDEDLYQLLNKCECMLSSYDAEPYTQTDLIIEYGVTADEWAMVKAIAGCKSDNVRGIAPGIGNKTAVRYILGNRSGKKMHQIASCADVIRRNLRLVQLPFDNELKLQQDRSGLRLSDVENAVWNQAMMTWQFKSLYRS